MPEGWGWGLDGVAGGSARGSNLDGWDEMDPMAMLSQSVQSRARAHAQESRHFAHQLNSQAEASQQAAPAQQLSVKSPRLGQTGHAEGTSDIHSHRLPSVQAYRPASSDSQSVSNTCSSPVSSESYRQDSTAEQVCMDELTVNKASGVTAQAAVSERPDSAGQQAHSPAHCSAAGGDSQAAAASVLTAESSLTDVERVLGPGDKAVVHTWGPGGDPFGPTTVHGYPGIVFELTQSGCIASVTVFDTHLQMPCMHMS